MFRLDSPRIRSFRGKVLKDNSMKMTCLAKGLPQPTYIIKTPNGLSFAADIHGVVIINDYKSVINASYTCIARNSVGYDQWYLNGILTISKGRTFRIALPGPWPTKDFLTCTVKITI